MRARRGGSGDSLPCTLEYLYLPAAATPLRFPPILLRSHEGNLADYSFTRRSQSRAPLEGKCRARGDAYGIRVG